MKNALIEKNRKLIVSIVIIVLFIFIIYASFSFISAYFGAAILAYLFYPMHKKFIKKGFSPRSSALIILVIALLIIVVPLIYLVNGLINQISLLPKQIERLKILMIKINEISPFNIQLDISKFSNQFTSILASSIRPIFSNVLHAFIILFLLFFLLYYLVLYSDKIKENIPKYLPFNEKTNKEIIEKFKQVTNATIIGTFFIAIVQGVFLTVNFFLLGIPNAIFWGFITIILSFLPVIGPPVVLVPAVLILFVDGEISKAIILIIVGLLISTIDNVIRPVINQRFGSIHPLTTIIGIFIGLSQFGIIGIFIGPLIVVYFLLFLKIYKEEYLKTE